MQQLHADLWIADSHLRFIGLEVGARMTVVRLPGPKLCKRWPNRIPDQELLILARSRF